MPPWPPGAQGVGPGRLHAPQRSASAAQPLVAAYTWCCRQRAPARRPFPLISEPAPHSHSTPRPCTVACATGQSPRYTWVARSATGQPQSSSGAARSRGRWRPSSRPWVRGTGHSPLYACRKDGETRFFQRKLLAPSRNNVKTERTGVGVAFFSSLPKDSGHDGALRLTKLIDSAQTVTTWGVQRRVYSSLHTAKTRPR